MTIITDNIRTGTVKGMGQGVGSDIGPTKLLLTVGDPSDVSIGQTGSDIARDTHNNQYYMNIGGIGGSTWVKLGSVS